MKKKSNIGWWIAGLAGALLLKKKATAVEGIGVGKVNPNRNGWTRVVYRKYPDGEIIALFPDIIETYRGDVLSYMHMGQHSPADYQWVIQSTKPAKPQEYMDLENELLRNGYNMLEHARRR